MDTKSQAALSNFMDLLLDAVCVVDRDGRFVFVSAAFERIFGYTPEEMIGRQMLEMVYPAGPGRDLAGDARDHGRPGPKFNFENR